MIICPLCGVTCVYDHIAYYHKSYWKSIGISEIPDNIEEFNKRFSLIGLKIKVLTD